MRRTLSVLGLLTVLLVIPASASAHRITPVVDCVQPTSLGYVAHFTYEAVLLAGDFDVPASATAPGINVVTPGPVDQGQPVIFSETNRQFGFQVYFRRDATTTWTVQHPLSLEPPQAATASASSPVCPAGIPGAKGDPGPPGPPGGPGANGKNGTNGKNGKNGKDADAQSCPGSQRDFPVHLIERPGQRIAEASVRVENKVFKAKRVYDRTEKRVRWRVMVNFKGLERGVYSIILKARLITGETVFGVRLYRTCYKKHQGLNNLRIPQRVL